MKTYLVELLTIGGHEVMEYCATLKDAKSTLDLHEKLKLNKGLSILCVSGPCFGEGYHQYRMIKVHCPKSGKFKWKRLKSSWDMKNY